VSEFLASAIFFLNTLKPPSPSWIVGNISPVLFKLEALLEPTASSLSYGEDGQVREEWVCPSLLSSFARMALQDIRAGLRILRCACCGSPFVTDKYQARYCSERCGWKQRKRRRRSSEHLKE
jgi:hypothetical protein